MEIDRYTSPLLDSNMYVISESGHCVMIDPCSTPEAKHLLSGLTLDFMLVTHEHYDHISGVNAYKSTYRAPLFASKICNENLQNPSKNFSKFFEVWLEAQGLTRQEIDTTYTCQADEFIQDGQTLMWMGHRMTFKFAPGHSAGSTLILLDNHILFSGDCLLRESVAALRLPGSDPEAFERCTLPYLKYLDGNMWAFPGHYGCFQLRDHYLLQAEKGK